VIGAIFGRHNDSSLRSRSLKMGYRVIQQWSFGNLESP
jgi:hypothetical protein